MLAPLSEVAAANPHAWFPVAHSAEELVTPTAANRMVGYPYTKHMVAIMDVDMAATVVLASEAAADRLGVPADRRVYLRGWAAGSDAIYVAEHPDLWRSPAMARVLPAAVAAAGVGIDDVAHLDLYSCFASSLLFATDALAIDPVARAAHRHRRPALCRGTGQQLPVACAWRRWSGVLRDDPGSFGLVSGVGMHLTNHVAAVYSTAPGAAVGPSAAPAARTRAGAHRRHLGRPGPRRRLLGRPRS